MWSSNQQNESSTKGPTKDDLHQWSIYRQNLNAKLTNSSSSSTSSTNELILKQSTVDNILSSKDYKNQLDDDNYLNYGLPRVKNLNMQSDIDQQQQTVNVKNQIKLFNEKQQQSVQNVIRKFDNRSSDNRSSDNRSSDNRSSDNHSSDNRNLKSRSSINNKQQIHNKINSDNLKDVKNLNNDKLLIKQSTDKLTINSSISKQWKSNPNLNNEKELFQDYLNNGTLSKQSISEYNINKLNNLDKHLEQFKKQYILNKDQTNDLDSFTKSLKTNSAIDDELNFQKKNLSSLNDDNLSLTNSFTNKDNLKKHQLQSSDSEFVLSLDTTIKSSTNFKQQHQHKFKQPHLTVNKIYHEFDSTSLTSILCGFPRQKIRVLDNVSLDVKSGDMLAIISTNQLESSTILDILMNQHSKNRTRTLTDIYFNGQFINETKLSKLTKYCSYVGPNTNNLCNNMSTRQTILFNNLLQSTNRNDNQFDAKKRIDALIDELGLNDVKHTSVNNLTESERIRLQIAIALMLDNDLLLLDQPIRTMDIFDSYFIIDYIRQYTRMTGKCAIIAIQPPSYEIFSLFNKICLISTGRNVYFGDRSKMNAYFSYANYPCPAFKNPADYYLDLVTVDYLSSTAMLESNHRIESLIQLYQKGKSIKKQKTIPSNQQLSSLSDKRRNSFIIDFLAIWIRAMIFCFPYNLINLSKRILFAISLSLVCGMIFFKMRIGREQEDIFDRFGFYHSLLAILSVPIYLLIIKDVHTEKKYVLEELRMKIYSKEAYFLSYLIYTFLPLSIMFMGFIIPASSIAIQKSDLFYYIVLMLCYLHIIRLLAIIVSWCFSTKLRSSIIFGLIYFVLIMISGDNLHFKNLNIVSKLMSNFSIYTHTYQSLINWEFNNNNLTTRLSFNDKINQSRFLCSGNPLVEKNAIITRAECGLQNHQNIVDYLSLKNNSINWTQLLIVYLSYVSILLSIWYLILTVISMNNSHLLQQRKKLKKQTSSSLRKNDKHEYCI